MQFSKYSLTPVEAAIPAEHAAPETVPEFIQLIIPLLSPDNATAIPAAELLAFTTPKLRQSRTFSSVSPTIPAELVILSEPIVP